MLKNRHDRRALIWALLLFPAVPVVGIALPQVAPLLFPLALYLGFCAGVLTHSHNHVSVFAGRGANRAYAIWLSAFYGAPVFSWIPTHNQNHHKFLNGPGDVTSTKLDERPDHWWTVASYPWRSARAQGPQLWTYAKAAWKRGRSGQLVLEAGAVVAAQACWLGLALALHDGGRGVLAYVLLALVPALFAPWSMMVINYLQHVDTDHESPDDHSRNFVDPVHNWWVFNAGYHTVHHENPGTHWSEYPALHRARAQKISPRLNDSHLLGFISRRYVFGQRG